MEKKNQKLTIIVSVLLLIVGVSFAFFITKSVLTGSGASGKVVTASIHGATINVEGTLEFNDKNILPGHKNISLVKVTATGNNETVAYNLIWKGTNNLATPLNYTVYKTTDKKEVSATCENKIKVIDGMQAYNEECTINGETSLGTVLGSGEITTSAEEIKEILASDEFITASTTGNTVYYYVILEYPNKLTNQNIDLGKGFQGTVTVEESGTQSDVNIIAAYIKEEGETEYKPSPTIPQSGYTLNTEMSSCTNGATPVWDYEKQGLFISSLTATGTTCNLYFDMDNSITISQLVASLNPTAGATSFTGIADTDEGVKSGTDYAGTTYYYRGAVTNNWVSFAGFYWRIIRINGDGTIRMIYNGTSTTTTGTGTQLGTKAFNTSNNSAEYVGLQYTLGLQRGMGTNSTILGTTNSTDATTLYGWYNTKIKGTNYEKYVDTSAVFCSDRDTVTNYFSGYTGSGTGTAQSAFAPAKRAFTSSWSWNTTQAPVMTCATNNQLRLPVGLITYDEVVYAGGFGGSNNSSYYLYTNKDYWTMSPYSYNGYARVFYVNTNGYFGSWDVNLALGVRPVINLKADTKLTGSGTVDSPYEVVS